MGTARGLEPLRPLLHDEHTAYILVGISGDARKRQDYIPIGQTAIDQATRAASDGAVRTYVTVASAFGQAVQKAEIADLTRGDDM